MTSHGSVADTGFPFDRRGFLATLVAAGTIGSGAAAAASSLATTSVDHPVAELLALSDLASAAEARTIEFNRAAEEAVDRIEFVDIPDALRWRPSDSPYVCFQPEKCAQYKLGDELEPVYEDGVKDLSNFAKSFAAQGDAYKNHRFFGADARARTLEIMAAHAEWESANKRAEDAAGYTVPSKSADQEAQTVSDLQRRMAAIPALTAAGIQAKARVANFALSNDPTWVERERLPNLISETGKASNGQLFNLLTTSLLVDALKLDVGATRFSSEGRVA